MVYLLKWLISLITPHTHDKEGKQGNSFIVRKALGNRASFSSLASKKGSSLLLVVMTMSVIIVISSSFMLLSFNTGIGSIFASSQQKAQLSCLSVAEGLKDGNTFGSIVNQYSGELSGNQTVEFNVNDSSLDGKTTVKLEPTTSGGSVKSVKVTVTTHVGSSKYEVKFTHTMQTNSVRDVINQVTNSMSVSGGGSYSLQTGKVEGDLSLDGDYLLAMTTFKENGDYWTVCPGEIDGNVYCNGSLIVGYKGEGRGIYQYKNKERINATAIPTIIKENLYVNGDLIINACEIEGDVYVSGNVLVNGLTTTVRGNTDDKSTSNTDNAIIKGNLYVGGSLFVPTGSFSRYFPTVEKVSTDSGANTETGGFTLSGRFPTFPSAAEIYGTERANDYNNKINDAYSKTIVNSTVDSKTGEYIFEFKDGETTRLSKNLLEAKVNGAYLVPNGTVDFGNGRTKIFSGDDYSYVEVKEDTKYVRKLVIHATAAMRWWDSSGDSRKEKDTWTRERAYNALFNLTTGVYWVGPEGGTREHGEAGRKADDITLRNTIIKNYEASIARCSYADINTSVLAGYLPTSTLKSLVTNKNVYIQNNAYIQTSTEIGKAGKVYIQKDLTAFSIEGVSDASGNNIYSYETTFNSVYVGGKIQNWKLQTKPIITGNDHYYSCYISLRGDDRASCRLEEKKNGERYYSFEKGKEYKFYYKAGRSFNEFKITGSTNDYLNNPTYYNQFRAENIGFTSEEGATKVVGLMAYGTNALWGVADTTVSGYKNKVSDATFYGLELNEDEMYSDEFLKNHNSSAALRTEQKRAEEVDTVADVLKEMGVWGYSEGEIYTKSYQNAYKGGKGRDEFYYNNLDKTGNSTGQYAVGDNKLNDRGGVNFTGVTSATQIKFGYTLQRAINASKKGTITVTSKGSIKHPSATSGTFFGNSDARDWRVLYKSKASYKNSPVGPQNIENLTKYFVYGAGGLGDTFYGRLLFLGAYDFNVERTNNYSETDRGNGWTRDTDDAKARRQKAFEKDVKEVMSYLYNPSLAGEDSAMWEKYGKEYVGVFGYDGYDRLCIYLMRDIYLGGDSYYGFGDKDTDDNDNGFQLHLDTSYRSINVYWGSDANGMLNYASNSTIEISLLFPQQGSFNVAYMYLLPNIAWSNYQDTGYSIMNYQQKIDNIHDIANAVQVQGAKVDGQNVYKGQSGKYYRYSVKYYRNIDTAGGSGGVGIRDVLNDCKFTYVCRMWDNCKIKNTAIRSNGNLVAAGIPFVMCEGPMLFMMGQKGEMSGIIYSPNPDSVFYCASESAIGTAASDSSTTFDGGAIVTGRVIGTMRNNGRWKFFEDSDKYDIGELLTKALIEDPYGIGDIDTSGGTNTGGNWSAGKYEE